jgi:hypothetical protein
MNTAASPGSRSWARLAYACPAQKIAESIEAMRRRMTVFK